MENYRRNEGRHISNGRRKRQKQLARRMLVFIGGLFIVLAGIIFLCKRIFFSEGRDPITAQTASDEGWVGAPALDVQLLDVNEYSRPGTPLEKIKGIVIHYVANPGTSAKANRDYFEGLKDAHTTKASSHFVIGLEGEIIQCIPSSEISYASNDRNKDTLSIECCHPDETGKFNESTYQSMVDLTGWLCARFGLDSQDVIRHYDVTGKICPKYFVEHEDAWEQFRSDVQTKADEIKELNS